MTGQITQQPEIDGLSPRQYLFLPFAVEIPLEGGIVDECDWMDAAMSISEVIQMVWKGQASIEDIIDCANDTNALDIDSYIQAVEEVAEERSLIIFDGVY